MTQYIVRRLLQTIPLLLLISVAVFGLIHAAPGGPMGVYTHRSSLRPEDIARLEEELGLNDPIPVQYVRWLGQLLRGDLGDSLVTRRPVVQEIGDRLLNTGYLMAVTLTVVLIVAIPVGIFSALKQYSVFDYIVTTITFLGQSIPVFWFGLILLLVFYGTLDNPFTGKPLLPAGGIATIGAPFSLWDRITHLILPVGMLTLTWTAWYTRFLRSSMLEVIRQDYIRTARAKGCDESRVVWGHALKNAAIPVVTLIAMDLPYIFIGAVYTETIFSWPGMGRLFYTSAVSRDYPVLMATVMISSVLIVTFNLVADVLYAYLDPRIRYD